MLRAWCLRFTHFLARQGVALADDAEVYAYGLQMGVEMLLNIATTLIIGFCMGMPLESLVLLAGYMSLRSYTGGYHAESALGCYIQSCCLIAGILFVCKIFPIQFCVPFILPLVVVSGAVVFAAAPVPATHKPLDEVEVVHYRKKSRIRLMAEIIVIVALELFRLHRLALVLSLGLFVITCLMLVGLFQNWWAFRNRE